MGHLVFEDGAGFCRLRLNCAFQEAKPQAASGDYAKPASGGTRASRKRQKWRQAASGVSPSSWCGLTPTSTMLQPTTTGSPSSRARAITGGLSAPGLSQTSPMVLCSSSVNTCKATSGGR